LNLKVLVRTEERVVHKIAVVPRDIGDEAARVADELLASVRPMLAVSNGKLVALSTPAP
jgi:hypothetical protein